MVYLLVNFGGFCMRIQEFHIHRFFLITDFQDKVLIPHAKDNGLREYYLNWKPQKLIFVKRSISPFVNIEVPPLLIYNVYKHIPHNKSAHVLFTIYGGRPQKMLQYNGNITYYTLIQTFTQNSCIECVTGQQTEVLAIS